MTTVQPVQSGAMLSASAAAQIALGSKKVQQPTRFQVLVRSLAGQEIKIAQPESLEALKRQVHERFGLPTLVQSLVSGDGVALTEERFLELNGSDSQLTVVASVEGVRTELASADGSASSSALDALVKLVEHGGGHAAAAVDVISEEFSCFQSSEARQEACAILNDAVKRGIRGAVDTTLALANHPDSQVRLASVKGLASELLDGNEEAAEVIAKGVFDSCAEVRSEALNAMSKVESCDDKAAVATAFAHYKIQSEAARAARDSYLLRTLDFRSMTGVGARDRFRRGIW